METLKVIYEDKDLLVCFKPAGVPTQTAALGIPDMVSLVKSYLVQQGSLRDPYLGLIHRLDQPVSGLLVFAKNKQAASLQLKGKHYYALCLGQTGEKEGVLKHLMWKNPKTNKAEIVEENRQSIEEEKSVVTAKGKNRKGQKDDAQIKEAVLSYQVKEQRQDCVLLQVSLQTGRFHQIRAQFSHIGHPLLGDLKYGSEESKRVSLQKQIKTIALCAYQISFLHPKTKKEMNVQIPRELLPFWISSALVSESQIDPETIGSRKSEIE